MQSPQQAPDATGLDAAGRMLTDDELRAAVGEGVDRAAPDGKRILLLVPDPASSMRFTRFSGLV